MHVMPRLRSMVLRRIGMAGHNVDGTTSMRLHSLLAAALGAFGIAFAAGADAAELRLSAVELDRVVAGDDAMMGESRAFPGAMDSIIRTINVRTTPSFPVLDPDVIGELLPPTVVPDPAPGLAIGLGRRDLFAAFRFVLLSR